MSLVSDPVVHVRGAHAPARPLRVAHIVTRLIAGAGGITLRGALAMDPQRYSSTILSGQGGVLSDRAVAAGIEYVPLERMPTTRGVYPRADTRGYRELVRHLAAGRYDIVHTHSSKAGAIGRIAARHVGVPTIVHSMHGFPFHEFQPLPVRLALVEIERRLSAYTDFFVTDGTFVAAEAVRLGIAPPDRIRAISSPIDDDIAPATPARRADARRRLGVPSDVKLIGTAARLDGQKAPLDMIRAVARLRRDDVRMVWIGDGHQRGEAEELIAREGLQERFLLVGERPDVAELLPAFDVFALASLYEGLPCAAVESMAVGVPVVATAVNSVPEIVIPGRTGLLARPADPASLSRALAYVLDHPEDGERMARAARAHIGDRFTAAALGRDLDEVYAAAARATVASGAAA